MWWNFLKTFPNMKLQIITCTLLVKYLSHGTWYKYIHPLSVNRTAAYLSYSKSWFEKEIPESVHRCCEKDILLVTNNIYVQELYIPHRTNMDILDESFHIRKMTVRMERNIRFKFDVSSGNVHWNNIKCFKCAFLKFLKLSEGV